jgi:hypothetical protein
VLLNCSLSLSPSSLKYPCPSVCTMTFLGLPAPQMVFLPSKSAALLLPSSYCFVLDYLFC